jgi:hypothetical protein
MEYFLGPKDNIKPDNIINNKNIYKPSSNNINKKLLIKMIDILSENTDPNYFKKLEIRSSLYKRLDVICKLHGMDRPPHKQYHLHEKVILYTTLRDNFLGTKILEISPYL